MATDSPLLSILLPTHNRADVLPFAVKSVLAQTFQDFELLLVGDGCTDGTDALAREWAANDARIRWFDLPKAPHFGYASRNVALREARGQFVGFMAHDDTITPDHFELLLAALQDPRVQLVHGGSAWVGVHGEIVPTVFHLLDRTMRSEFAAMRWNRVPATAFVHRRAIFERVGYWNESLPRAGDMDLWNRIIQAFGEQSLQVVETVTTFHFRAHWRTQDQMAPDNEPLWQILHRQPGRLPAALKMEIKPDETEQAAWWRNFSDHPAALAELRKALVLAVQSFAWEMELRVGAQSLKATGSDIISGLQKEAAKHRQRAERLREELDRAKARTAPRSLWRRLWQRNPSSGK